MTTQGVNYDSVESTPRCTANVVENFAYKTKNRLGFKTQSFRTITKTWPRASGLRQDPSFNTQKKDFNLPDRPRLCKQDF